MKIFHLLPLLFVTASALAADFSKKEMAGQRLSLLDETRLETYQFGDSDIALVQIGIKGGAVAGPAYHWKLDNGKIVFSDGKGANEIFELIEHGDKWWRVRRRSGRIDLFEVERVKK